MMDYISHANWNYGSNSAAFNYMSSLYTCNFSRIVMVCMSNDPEDSIWDPELNCIFTCKVKHTVSMLDSVAKEYIFGVWSTPQ